MGTLSFTTDASLPPSLPPERSDRGEYGDGGAGRGAGSHQRCFGFSSDASTLILLAFEPPYLPALGGRAGTLPHSAPPLGEQLRGAGRNLSPIRLRLWGNSRGLEETLRYC